MNIYNAIMRAADYIQGHPSDFQFSRTSIPRAPECGMPGCALGWIGTFARLPEEDRRDGIGRVAGHNKDGSAWDDRQSFLQVEQLEFYFRMQELTGTPRTAEEWGPWVRDPKICAAGLRLYAERYHASEKPCRSDSELVADLMTRVTGSRIPDEAPCNVVSA